MRAVAARTCFFPFLHLHKIFYDFYHSLNCSVPSLFTNVQWNWWWKIAWTHGCCCSYCCCCTLKWSRKRMNRPAIDHHRHRLPSSSARCDGLRLHCCYCCCWCRRHLSTANCLWWCRPIQSLDRRQLIQHRNLGYSMWWWNGRWKRMPSTGASPSAWIAGKKMLCFIFFWLFFLFILILFI